MNSQKDSNRINTLICASNLDGVTPINVLASPTANALNIQNGVTGTDFGTTNAQRDGNRIPVLIAVSALDGITPVEIYADSSGNLLVRSN